MLGSGTYPWHGRVKPVWLDPAPDLAFAARVRQWHEQRPDLAATFVTQRGWYYRVGAPVLGEPLSQMTCSRDTGHLGSGLYFFGTLDAAVGVTRSLEGIYRVEGGPQQPYRPGVLGDAWTDAWALHAVGRALLCWPARSEDLRELEAEEDPNRYELDDLRRKVRRDRMTLETSPLRLDLDLRRAEAAIQRAVIDGKYHPMTYYMRSLGYDGVVHSRSWRAFTTGDMGNIWYPEV